MINLSYQRLKSRMSLFNTNFIENKNVYENIFKT